MFNFIEGISYEQMAWFTVVVYILHFAEEGPRLVKWFNTYLPRKVRKFLPYSQLKLNMENIILFAHVLVIAILINIYPGNWILQGLVLASGIGHIQNTIFHAVPTPVYGGLFTRTGYLLHVEPAAALDSVMESRSNRHIDDAGCDHGVGGRHPCPSGRCFIYAQDTPQG